MELIEFSVEAIAMRRACILMIIALAAAVTPARSPAASVRRVAVLEFDARGGGLPADAGAMAAEMLITALGREGCFTLQERVLLKKVLAEQKLSLSGVVDAGSGVKIGRVYGVDALVAGAVMAWNGRVTVTARLIASETGTVIRTAEIAAPDLSGVQRKMPLLARLLAGTASLRERMAAEGDGGGAVTEGGVAVAAAGAVFREKTTGMEFVFVKGGCFDMGQSERERKMLVDAYGGKTYRRIYGDEGPVHRVCLGDFWLGRTEVTNGQFRLFRPDHSSHDFRGRSLDRDDQPVTYVSWREARAFAAWLTVKYRDRVFSLPSEAQWEYGCRAGSVAPRFWGWDADEACRYANVLDRGGEERIRSGRRFHDCDDGFAVTAPAASFAPNPLGLYDMLGNVWEWTMDSYFVDGYLRHHGRDPLVSDPSPYRVRRGGSWKDEPGSVRCANRGHRSVGARNSRVGFRLIFRMRPAGRN